MTVGLHQGRHNAMLVYMHVCPGSVSVFYMALVSGRAFLMRDKYDPDCPSCQPRLEWAYAQVGSGGVMDVTAGHTQLGGCTKAYREGYHS
jgi:hypothetical protein